MNTSVVVSYFNDIPILDIMNVKGYCVNINGKMRTFLFAKDIAIGGGLDFIQKDTKILATSCKNNYINTGVRWNTMNKYAYESLHEIIPYDPDLQYLTQLPINEYSFIPQEIAYLIIMRCNNAKAREFRAKLSLIVSDITNNTIIIMQKNYNDAISYLNNIIRNKNKFIEEQNEKIGSLEYFLDEKDKKIENEINGVTLDDIDYVSSIYNIDPDKLRDILFDLKVKIDYQMTENDF